MKIIILKTSNDATLKKLLEEKAGDDILCLVPDNQIAKIKNEVNNCKFISIKKDSFYNIPDEIITNINKEIFDECYITLSGSSGHNYENVLVVVRNIKYKKAYFYNYLGQKTQIISDKIGILKVLIRIVEGLCR